MGALRQLISQYQIPASTMTNGQNQLEIAPHDDPGYELDSERADVEAVVEIVGSLMQRWEKRIPKEAKTKLWQHNKFDPNPWPALTASYAYDVPVRTAASLDAALIQLKNAMDFLADPPTEKPNLTLARSCDTAAREMADLGRSDRTYD